MSEESKIYDVVVIGGGPAGMMAAGVAAEKSKYVVLIEKNERLGIKLLITGKGRCNITNAEEDLRAWIEKFGKNGKFLYGAFNKFSNTKVLDFFNSRGVKTKIERGGRIFPASDKSSDVLDALTGYLNEGGIDVKFNSTVDKIVTEDRIVKHVVLSNGEIIKAKKYIISTGGKSYPMTGSSGDGHEWLEKIGHTIVKPSPALVPIILKEKWIKEVEGLSLKNVEISIYRNNKKQDSRFGEALFTANGMSGPIILDMSKKIGELLNDKLELKIDFKPNLNYKELDRRIQSDFQEFNNKDFRNSLDKLLPKKLIPTIIKLSGISEDKKVNLITQDERKKILHLLKDFSLNIKRLDGFNKAIITSGGVATVEIDPQTMQSKIIDNLYICGELLDLDGPTGGYNLQVCWSTGYVAGEGVTTQQ
jgi:predicted Rossmann fold flavoprotein